MQVEHELSVPAVSIMMMSWAAFSVTAMTGAKLGQRIVPQRRQQLQGAAALGCIAPAVAVSMLHCSVAVHALRKVSKVNCALQVAGLGSPLTLTCTLMAVLGAAVSAALADT